MKLKLIFVFLFLMIAAPTFSMNSKTTLSGKVSDRQTGKAMPGVNVYVPDLKTGSLTDSNGTFLIQNLPLQKVLIQISFAGYQTLVSQVDLTKTPVQDFTIEPSVKEIKDLVITGLSKAGERNRTPTSIAAISHLSLLQNASTNIIDAITTQAGVSQVSTGVGISKPVIRGLGYNRVVVVNDGIRQEGQQWGDEHGIEIDENTVYKVEILKGPASLAFGSDAIAGVVNMISYPSLPYGMIKGTLVGNYQSNNGLVSISGDIAGNHKGFIWDLRYSNKMAHAYQNKYDGYVYNSGFKENDLNALIGLTRSWGYSHLSVSSYHLMPGIISGMRDSSSGKFLKDVALNDTTSITQIASTHDMLRYTPAIDYQQIHHTKLVWNNTFYVREGSLKMNLGYQQNRRQEFSNVFKPDQYGLYFLLNTMNYDVRYVLPEMKKWNIATGLNGMWQHAQNKGNEFLIPAYNLLDAGVYIIAKKAWGPLDLSGGVRYDIRDQQAMKLLLDASGQVSEMDTAGTLTKFKSFHDMFQGVSGSVGAAYQFSKKVFMKLNGSKGYRAPNIGELAANGEHEGTKRYEIGDAHLLPESSWELDATLGMNTEHLSIELDLFDNRIKHFIYQRKLNSVLGGDSITQGLSTFLFTQGDANLMGAELMVDIHPHPLDWLHFENSFSYVQAQQYHQVDSMRNLPMIPAARLRTEIKIEKTRLGSYLRNLYLKTDIENYFPQHKIYQAFGTETATPGYTLINAGMGANVQHRGHLYASIFISVTNLTNRSYQSHLSRLKYLEINQTNGRSGVYNMGRNLSLKMVLPIEFQTKKQPTKK